VEQSEQARDPSIETRHCVAVNGSVHGTYFDIALRGWRGARKHTLGMAIDAMG
jgi:hypothetical protein